MKNKKIIIVISCLLIIVLCALGYITFNGNKSTDNSNAEEKDTYMEHINDPSTYENGAIGVGD